MAAQQWIVFFTLLVSLCTFKAEVAPSGECKTEIIQQLHEVIAALENCNYHGKSFNLSLKGSEKETKSTKF